MWKPYRSVLFWLASVAGLQAVVDQAHDRRIEQSGYARGYAAGVAEMREKMPPIFGERPVYIPVIPLAHEASVHILSLPPSAVYEPPEKQTGPTRPVNPEQLKRLIGTQTLPIVPGEMARKWREQRDKAGE